MQIRIHTCGGPVETFVQDDPALAARILNQIQPAKVFTGEILTIAGEFSMTSFATSKVNRVDLIAEDAVNWNHPGELLDAAELSKEEFRDRCHIDDPSRQERRRHRRQAGEAATCFVELVMIGDSRVFLAAKIIVPLEVERLHRLRLAFSAPAIHFKMRPAGISILNLKNIVRVTFFPGPNVTPLDAWPAHHMPETPSSEVYQIA
jgi:hypothetical protein